MAAESRIVGLIVAAQFALTTIALEGCASPAGATDVLDVSLRLARSAYERDGPLDVECILRNVGAAPVVVNRRFRFPGPEVYLRIRDEHGVAARWLAPEPPGPLRKDDFIALASGEQLHFTLHHVQRHLLAPLPPGRYTMTVVYRNRSGTADVTDAWVGEVVSSPVHFRVAGLRSPAS